MTARERQETNLFFQVLIQEEFMAPERVGNRGNRCQYSVARAVLRLSLRVSGCSVAVCIYSTLGGLGGSWGQTKLGGDIRHLASPGAMETGRLSPALCRHWLSPARCLFSAQSQEVGGGRAEA